MCHFHSADIFLDHRHQTLSDKTCPHLIPGRQSDPARNRLRIGSIQHEQIRKVGDHHADIGAWVLRRPALMQIHATPADVFSGPQVLDNFKSCGSDDDVNFTELPIAGFNSVFSHAHNVLRDEFCILAR